MSWIDKIKTDLTITTGDGKSYTPKWLNASKSIEYKIATFEFRNISGTLVKKGLPMGTRYAIEINFDGENHLDVANAFELSAANPGPWTMAHPLYGSVTVQPANLIFDNESLNVSKITGLIIETITEDQSGRTTVSAPDKIVSDISNFNAVSENACATQVKEISAQDSKQLSQNSDNIFKQVSKKIKDSTDASAFLNAYNKVNGIISSGTFDTLSTVRAIRDFTTLPYTFSDLLQNRVNMFALQFEIVSNNLSNLFSRSSKRLYENTASNTITGMILSSITNIGAAYDTIDGVFPVMDLILNTYNQYITNLDGLQTENGASPDSFIPDDDTQTILNELVCYAVNELEVIAKGSKQRRDTILQDDDNVISIAHRLYGLQSDDSTIDQLISNNNIGLNELLQLKKGRRIIYYV